MKSCWRSAKARIWKSIVIATVRTMTSSRSDTIASMSVKPRRLSVKPRGPKALREQRHIVHPLAALEIDAEVPRRRRDVRRRRRDGDDPEVLHVVARDRVRDLVRAVL